MSFSGIDSLALEVKYGSTNKRMDIPLDTCRPGLNTILINEDISNAFNTEPEGTVFAPSIKSSFGNGIVTVATGPLGDKGPTGEQGSLGEKGPIGDKGGGKARFTGARLDYNQSNDPLTKLNVC